jgi:hypothetical protein
MHCCSQLPCWIFVEPLASELRELYVDGTEIYDAFTGADRVCKAMLLFGTADIRGFAKLAMVGFLKHNSSKPHRVFVLSE